MDRQSNTAPAFDIGKCNDKATMLAFFVGLHLEPHSEHNVWECAQCCSLCQLKRHCLFLFYFVCVEDHAFCLSGLWNVQNPWRLNPCIMMVHSEEHANGSKWFSVDEHVIWDQFHMCQLSCSQNKFLWVQLTNFLFLIFADLHLEDNPVVVSPTARWMTDSIKLLC